MAAVVVGLAFASCEAPPHRQATVVGFAVNSRPRVDSVVVVAIDGARWQDVFETPEVTPTLHRWMTEDGIGLGAPDLGEVWASGPNYISMPGYTEILTGRPSACQTNTCGSVPTPTLVDQVTGAGEDAVVVSSWELISHVAAVDPWRATLSTGRHLTARTDDLDPVVLAEGRSDEPWPGVDDYRPDEITSRLALRLLDRRLPRFAFFGLGDTDEHAHHGDRKRYLEALGAADQFLAELEKRVSRRTVIFVTADHGRSASFRDHGGGDHDSGRVWLAVRAPNLPTHGMLRSRTLHLADIAPTVRCLLDLPPDNGREAGRSIDPICSH